MKRLTTVLIMTLFLSGPSYPGFFNPQSPKKTEVECDWKLKSEKFGYWKVVNLDTPRGYTTYYVLEDPDTYITRNIGWELVVTDKVKTKTDDYVEVWLKRWVCE